MDAREEYRNAYLGRAHFGDTSAIYTVRDRFAATALRKTIAQAPPIRWKLHKAHLVKVDGLTIRNPLLEIRLCSCPETSPLCISLSRLGCVWDDGGVGGPPPTQRDVSALLWLCVSDCQAKTVLIILSCLIVSHAKHVVLFIQVLLKCARASTMAGASRHSLSIVQRL